MIGPGDILSKSTNNLRAMALIKQVLDGVGIKEIVDWYAPMERKGGITNGDVIQGHGLEQAHVSHPALQRRGAGERVRPRGGVRHSLDEMNYGRLARALGAVSTRIEDIEADVTLRIMPNYRIRPERGSSGRTGRGTWWSRG